MSTSALDAGSLFNVNGIVAVVTGGGTGIGLVITKALVANDAHEIYIIGRRLEVLQEAARITEPNVVFPLPGDVTPLETLLPMTEHVRARSGYVNLVIANAWIMGPQPLKYRAHALQTPMEYFINTYAVNTTSVYYTEMALSELLDEGSMKSNMAVHWRSQVIATSSIGGFSRLNGASLAYNSSKAAVTHMMKIMATAFVPYKIRFNVLAPGIFPSDLAGAAINNLGPGQEGVLEPSFVPAERAGKEEDIAGAILYLASNTGAYLNGSVVVVDGGRLGTLVSTY